MKTKTYTFTEVEIYTLRDALIEQSIQSKYILKQGVLSPAAKEMHISTIELARQFKQDVINL